MHPHLKSLLVSHGLAQNASDDDAQSYYSGLSAEDKSDIDGKVARMCSGEGDAAAMAAKPGDPHLSQRAPTPAPPPGEAVTVPAVPVSPGIVPVSTNTAGQTQNASMAARQSTAAAQHAQSDEEIQLARLAGRVKTIKSMAQILAIPDDEVPEFIGMVGTIEEVKTAMLGRAGSKAKPAAGRVVINVGTTPAQRIAEAIPFAMLSRSSMFGNVGDELYTKLGVKKPEMVDALKGRKAIDMMKMYLESLGIRDAWQVGDRALLDAMGPRGMRRLGGQRIAALAESTSDFGNLTLDAINKSLRFLYLDSKRTWPIWAQKVFNADFKNINRIVLSEVNSMQSRNEGGEVKYAAMTDSKEVYALGEYVTGIRFTRRLIINDDMDALANVPRLLANSAARLEEDTAYGVLTGNPSMADGGTVFNATATTATGGHANFVASGGPPTSVAALQQTAGLIETQLGLGNKAVLELEPKFLLVPTTLKWSTAAFIQSEKLVAATTTAIGDANPFFKQLQVIASRRLYANSATAWYLLSDFRDGQTNTVEVCFLTDEPEPVIRQETDFDTEDVKMLGRHTVAAKAIDFRGMAKNNGA